MEKWRYWCSNCRCVYETIKYYRIYHNRGRMIVASFLTKNLLVDWRIGEKYFAQNLIDYNMSANNGGWQWASGSGTDAQPYFRIFNPYTQSLKFDNDCVYIKKWLPQLKDIPNKHIHNWENFVIYMTIKILL